MYKNDFMDDDCDIEGFPIEEKEEQASIKESIVESFDIWFHEEGKFMVHQGEYIDIKELLLIAWMNGAYKAITTIS